MIKSKTKYIPYKVKDINEAQWGRDQIKLAESEMPGLMSLRAGDGRFQGNTDEAGHLHLRMQMAAPPHLSCEKATVFS